MIDQLLIDGAERAQLAGVDQVVIDRWPPRRSAVGLQPGAGAHPPDALLVPLAALTSKPGGFRVRPSTGDYVEVRPGLYDKVAGSTNGRKPSIKR